MILVSKQTYNKHYQLYIDDRNNVLFSYVDIIDPHQENDHHKIDILDDL